MTRTAWPAASAGLLWFRRDLRLTDNPAWSVATSEHRTVTALYVLDDRLWQPAGPLQLVQLVAELHELDVSLRARGGRLMVQRGDPTVVVPSVAAGIGAARVHWNADVTPYATKRDAAVRSVLTVDATTPYGHLVLPPGSVTTRDHRVHRVFSAFYHAWRATPWDAWQPPGDARIASDAGEGLPRLAGEPPYPPGEHAARTRLCHFAAQPVDSYRQERDHVAERGTSELSVALKFGTLSPREIIESVEDRAGHTDEDREAFIRQLGWRDWYAHLLAEQPDLPGRAMRREYDRVPWRDDPEGLAAWREGRTGYPIVDAGMRELAARRKDAQPGPHDHGVLPGEGPTHRLALG